MIAKETNYCNEVKKVVFPLLFCNWIFGIGILEYPLGRPHRRLSAFYIASILSIYCLLSIYSYPHITDYGRQIEANQSIAKVFFGCHIILILISIILGWLRSEKMHLILERGTTADKFLRKIETNKDCHTMLKWQLRKVVEQVIIIFMAASIINLSYVYQKNLTTGGITSIIIFNYPLIVLSIADATFINLVQYSRSKFKRLNSVLKDTLTSTCECPQHSNALKYYKNETDSLDEPTKPIIISDKVHTINMARKAHLNSILFCEMINEAFATHILISIIVAIFVLTMSFYHSYGVFTTVTSKSTYYQQVFPIMITLIVYNSVKIHLFTKCCSDVTQETVITGDIISEIYDETINEESKDEIRNFEIQLIQHPLKFHLCNFIDLDYTLTQKVIEKVTTNLVILTQCGKMTLRTSE